jgi:hypothetical protein
MINCINGFFREYRFLSNFYPCKVEYEGITYPSTEHAYQAAKTVDVEERKKIATIVKSGDVKRYGRYYIKIRSDWEQVKLGIMLELNRKKFVGTSLTQKLLDTYPCNLEETNHWNDTFWGVCNGVGENNLGKILMQVRQEIKDRSEYFG